MESNHLYYLGFHGPSFTWQRGRVLERLDRAISNEAWGRAFPNCLVTHLAKIKSDHRPLLVDLCLNLKIPRGRPFRFLAGWAQHQNFSEIVNTLWDNNGDMSHTLNRLILGLKDWYKNIFGHI